MIFYELWDKPSRNLLGSYGTHQKALALAARIIATDPPSADRLTLDWGDDDDEDAGGLLAEGTKLADLISGDRSAPASSRRRASY